MTKYYDTKGLSLVQINHLVKKIAKKNKAEPKTTMFFRHKIRGSQYIYFDDESKTVTWTSFLGDKDPIIDKALYKAKHTSHSVDEWLYDNNKHADDVFKECVDKYFDDLTGDDCFLWHDYASLVDGCLVRGAINFYIDREYFAWKDGKIYI